VTALSLNDSRPRLNPAEAFDAARFGQKPTGVMRLAQWALGWVALPLALASALTGCANFSLPDLFGARSSAATAQDNDVRVPWGTTPEQLKAAIAAANAARSSGASGATASMANNPAYRIGPEDALEISVWKDDSLKSATLVRPDGGISFPLVGDLQVAGKTAAEVREEIAKRLARFMPEPEVTVSVVRVASYRVYVIGRVNKPGDIAVGRPLDVLQALSLAGGMTPFAGEDSIRIIRRIDGQQVAIPFDYSRLRKGGDLSQNITLRSGDVLFVP
jgi:polysaccharide biosynthesis/export protein